MIIKVTQEDIDGGTRGESETCAISRAVNRLTAGHAETGDDTIRIYPAKEAYKPLDYDLPEDAKQFVSRFDKGHPVSPFAFELPIPDGICLTEVSE